jgi:hypothetical protein
MAKKAPVKFSTATTAKWLHIKSVAPDDTTAFALAKGLTTKGAALLTDKAKNLTKADGRPVRGSRWCAREAPVERRGRDLHQKGVRTAVSGHCPRGLFYHLHALLLLPLLLRGGSAGRSGRPIAQSLLRSRPA